ncbi:Flp pilus assembly protein CpaB [Roseobacteraceae bacterium S113]
MRVVFGLVLVLGLGLAGFAVYMVNGYINSYQAALAEERANQPKIVPTVEVFVAKDTLKYGQAITQEHVRTISWPKAHVPEGAFTSEQGELFTDDVTQRFVVRAMEKDEPVLLTKVTAPGKDAGLASRLGEGMTAVTLKVDATSGLSGFVRPGDRVDVLFTGNVTTDAGRRDVTQIIQQNVEVLAVDQSTNADTYDGAVARNITVKATGRQATRLTLAQSSGSLTFTLRGIGDESIQEDFTMDQLSLLGITPSQGEPAPVLEAPEKVCTRVVRRGVERIETPVPCPTN